MRIGRPAARAASAMACAVFEADRVGGRHGGQRLTPAVTVRADAGALRVEIPQCAIERIARRAGRHQVLQRLAGKPFFHRFAQGLDRRGNALDGLTVALA